MSSKSKSQQRLMGMVYAYKTGKLDLEDLPKSLANKIKGIADGRKRTTGDKRKKTKGISDEDARRYASTKHKGLPEKIEEKIITKFDVFVNEGIKHLLKPKDKEEIGKIYKKDNLSLEIENGYTDKQAKSIIKRYSNRLNSSFEDTTKSSVVDFRYEWYIKNKIYLTFSKYHNNYYIDFSDRREYSLKKLKNDFFQPNYIDYSDYQFRREFYYFDHAIEFLQDCNIDTTKIKDK